MTVDRDETCSEWAMILVIASCTVTSRVNGSFDHTVVCMGDVHGWDWSLGFERGSTSSSNVQEAGSSLTRSLYNAPQSPTFFFIISIISSIDQSFSFIPPNSNLQYFHSSNPESPTSAPIQNAILSHFRSFPCRHGVGVSSSSPGREDWHVSCDFVQQYEYRKQSRMLQHRAWHP